MRFKKSEKNIGSKSTSVASGKSVIGIDIGQIAIKMVQLSGKQANQLQLEKYAIEYLPNNIISGNEIVDYDQLVSHLQQCYSKLKTNCKQVNLALPFGAVTIEEDLIFDPKSSDMSLQEFVESHVSVVASLDEMNYDWAVLSQDSNGLQSVLMVAAKTESVDKCTDLADEISVNAINVDVDLFALANAFSYADNAQQSELGHSRVAIFDIGDSSMKTLVIESAKILYKQESSLGLEQLVQLVQRNYQVTDVEALGMISGSVTRPSDYHDLVSNSFNMQIAQEVQRAIQFFRTTESPENSGEIKHILISGSGCIHNTGIEEMIYEQTNIPVKQIAPIMFTSNKTKIDDAVLEKDANTLTIAFGLALRGLV